MAEAENSNAPRPAVRAGDAEREAVAEQLRAAVAVGRLRLDELDERLSAVYAATTDVELAAVTADLPVPKRHDDRPLMLRTQSGSLRKNGFWHVPSRIDVDCASGSIVLDFTAAECRHPDVNIDVAVSSGSVSIIVPRGWSVEMGDVSVASGSASNKVTSPPLDEAPTVHIAGNLLSGSLVARFPRRSFRQWWAERRR